MVLIPKSAPEYDEFVGGKRVQMYEIHYLDTETEHEGVVRIPKAGATKESIAAAIRKDAAAMTGLLGKELGVK